MSLKTLDLNLLKVLDALISERSVTRAGVVLGRSQPAVSNALHRLRALLGDELFVRGADGLVLTPRAEALRAPLRLALASLEASLFEETDFDPATASGLLRISTPDRLSIAVVPPLFDLIQRHAPNMSLHVATADRHQALQLIEDDQIDVALGWLDDKPGHMLVEPLMEEYLYCVFRPNHPLARRRARFDIDAVLSYPHIVVSASGGRAAIFDDLLARNGLARRALVTVSNFTSVPHLLARSDMIGVFTKLASDVFESSFGLATRRVPLEIGKIATNMVWHMRNDRDRRHAWLRQQIKAVYRDL